MSDAEHRDIAEALFEPKQGRAEIKDAIKLAQEAINAASVNGGTSLAFGVSAANDIKIRAEAAFASTIVPKMSKQTQANARRFHICDQ